MAGFITLDSDRCWSARNFIYWQIVDYLLEALSAEEPGLVESVRESRYMQSLEFALVREENGAWHELTLDRLAAVAQRCARGELPCRVEGRMLDGTSQSQFQHAAAELAKMIEGFRQ